MKLFGFELKTPWSKVETKASEVADLIARQYGGAGAAGFGAPTKRNLAQYADEGYRKNVIVYSATRMVARAVASIPLEVKRGVGKKATTLDTHPLVDLIRSPNPWTTKSEFIEAITAHLMLQGNAYVEGIGSGKGAPLELWPHRPDRMKVLPGKMGVEGYRYELNGGRKDWKCDPITGASEIMHMKLFNPLDDWYGQSCIEAAAFSVDGHNEAGAWNQALLQNAARPSGALVYTSQNGGQLSDKQYERLKEELAASYSGSRNSGRPMILDGGLDWKSLSLSPAEMDWLNGKNISAREIALTLMCAPQLLGIPGDNTYSNYQEARQSLYEDSAIPLLQFILDWFNKWLAPAYEEDLHIEMNTDRLPAFAEKRAKQWAAVVNAPWLTVNEKREATGYDPLTVPEADEIWQPAGLAPLSGAIDRVVDPNNPPEDPNTDKPDAEKKDFFGWLEEPKELFSWMKQ